MGFTTSWWSMQIFPTNPPKNSSKGMWILLMFNWYSKEHGHRPPHVDQSSASKTSIYLILFSSHVWKFLDPFILHFGNPVWNLQLQEPWPMHKSVTTHPARCRNTDSCRALQLPRSLLQFGNGWVAMVKTSCTTMLVYIMRVCVVGFKGSKIDTSFSSFPFGDGPNPCCIFYVYHFEYLRRLIICVEVVSGSGKGCGTGILANFQALQEWLQL